MKEINICCRPFLFFFTFMLYVMRLITCRLVAHRILVKYCLKGKYDWIRLVIYIDVNIETKTTDCDRGNNNNIQRSKIIKLNYCYFLFGIQTPGDIEPILILCSFIVWDAGPSFKNIPTANILLCIMIRVKKEFTIFGLIFVFMKTTGYLSSTLYITFSIYKISII